MDAVCTEERVGIVPRVVVTIPSRVKGQLAFDYLDDVTVYSTLVTEHSVHGWIVLAVLPKRRGITVAFRSALSLTARCHTWDSRSGREKW